MGKTSNFAVVAAQLYTLGKCHGVHFFLVQMRSLEDHSSLPGNPIVLAFFNDFLSGIICENKNILCFKRTRSFYERRLFETLLCPIRNSLCSFLSIAVVVRFFFCFFFVLTFALVFSFFCNYIKLIVTISL